MLRTKYQPAQFYYCVKYSVNLAFFLYPTIFSASKISYPLRAMSSIYQLTHNVGPASYILSTKAFVRANVLKKGITI